MKEIILSFFSWFLVWHKVWLSLASLIVLFLTLYLIFHKLDAEHKHIQNSSIKTEDMDHNVPQLVKEHFVEPVFEPYTGQMRYSEFTKEYYDDDDEINGRNVQEGFSLQDIGDFFNKIGDFFDKVGRFFRALDQLGPRFTRFGQFFPDFGDGVKMEFDNLGKALKLGFEDIFDVVKISFSYFERIMNASSGCVRKYIDNYKTCNLFYFLDIGYWVAYGICYQFPLFLLKTITGFDLENDVLKDLWQQVVVPLDDLFHDMTADSNGKGYHFIHWPDYVQDLCYSCNIMNVAEDRSDIINAANKVTNDWKYDIPDLLQQPRSKFQTAWEDVTQLFQPLDF